MKTIKCATLDGQEVDFLSVSDPNGPELEAYASERLIRNTKDRQTKSIDGETMEYDVKDEKVQEHVKESVERNKLLRIPVGTYDFV